MHVGLQSVLTLRRATSVTNPSGPASEASSTSVFAPLTEFSASTRAFFAISLNRFTSRVDSSGWAEFWSSDVEVEAAICG